MPLRLASCPYLENSALVSILMLRQILEIFFFCIHSTLFLLFFFFLKQFKSEGCPFHFAFKTWPKRDLTAFFNYLKQTFLILVIAPWPPHPILHLLSEEGRSPCCPQAAVWWGNPKSLNLSWFKRTAHSLDALVRWGWAARLQGVCWEPLHISRTFC